MDLKAIEQRNGWPFRLSNAHLVSRERNNIRLSTKVLSFRDD